MKRRWSPEKCYRMNNLKKGGPLISSHWKIKKQVGFQQRGFLCMNTEGESYFHVTHLSVGLRFWHSRMRFFLLKVWVKCALSLVKKQCPGKKSIKLFLIFSRSFHFERKKVVELNNFLGDKLQRLKSIRFKIFPKA